MMCSSCCQEHNAMTRARRVIVNVVQKAGGVSLGPILGPLLFSVFVNYFGTEFEHLVNKFADANKLRGVLEFLRGWILEEFLNSSRPCQEMLANQRTLQSPIVWSWIKTSARFCTWQHWLCVQTWGWEAGEQPAERDVRVLINSKLNLVSNMPWQPEGLMALCFHCFVVLIEWKKYGMEQGSGHSP